MDTITYLKDCGRSHQDGEYPHQFTQAYIKTAIEVQHKVYDSNDPSNDCGACYALLDSLDTTFKMYVEAHLPEDFSFPLVWMQLIKALQSDLLEHFKTMKQELENIKPQQYSGQNVTNMDVTYHCQALTTAGIWGHQLCSSILAAFLHANGDEMYCLSLITMKATLEDKLKKVRFMEHAAGTTHLSDKGLS